jgi:hypothetical protein
MTIDMHAHWKPPILIEALRARTEMPRIATNKDGGVVYIGSRGEQPLEKAFNNVDQRLVEMDRFGVTTAVLSLQSAFTWIERLPVEESLPLIRLYNDGLAEICSAHEGRFAAFASLPLVDMVAAAGEFERALAMPGIIGVMVPGNAFLDLDKAEQLRPLLAVANKHRAVVLIHFGPMPGDAWPRVAKDIDNYRHRVFTLDQQASLSSNMVTLCMTDILDPYPDAIIQVHNLGGNMSIEIERMDHRSLVDAPGVELPSQRFARSKVYLDCNSIGPRAIEAGVRAFGSDRILFGTDGSAFGTEWSIKALNDADIDDDARQRILHGNAAAMLAHLVPAVLKI